MKEASLKADNDLKAKQSAADETISNLRAKIQRMRDEDAQEQRKHATARAERERELKNLERVIEEMRAKIDRILAA
jgi:hypothetical protein